MYYVYTHWHHDTGYPVCFYVGKGKDGRAWVSDSTRNKMWHSVVAKHGCDVVIHSEGLTEEQAFKVEAGLIRSIGRRDLGTGTLVNFSDGGYGGPNGNPESIARSAEGQRRSWADKREMRKASLKDAWTRRVKRNDPNQRKAAREWNLKFWSDPEKRAAQSAKIKAGIAAKKSQPTITP